MYWIADILMLAFVGILLYRGIRYGFTNTFFTFFTAILWIVLAIASSAALVFFVLKPIGVMQDVANAFRGAGDGLCSFFASLGVTGIQLPELEAINIFAGTGFEAVDINGYIVDILDHYDDYTAQIDRVVHEYLYNLDDSARVGGEYIVSAVQEKIKARKNAKGE